MNFGPEFSLPPAQWPLTDAGIHVWAANLDTAAAPLASLKPSLSPDELARAEKFHSERDQNRFIAGRGILRAILGSYWELPPAQLEFVYGPHGKPALAKVSGKGELHFNVAHSSNLLLIAVTRVCAVGVDVEWVRPLKDAEGIAERFFSKAETETLKALPETQQPAAFFHLWTRKEAYLKATGEGLEKIQQIEVPFVPGEPARIITIAGDPHAGQSWTLAALAPAAGVVAAVAAPVKPLTVSCWRWPL